MKSKRQKLSKILADWDNKSVSNQKEPIFNKIPKSCVSCKSEEIEYWDETDEEIVFQCQKCKRYYSIPYDQNKIHFYFSY